MKYKKRILTYVLLISLIINCFPKLEVKAVSDAFRHADSGRGCLYYTDSSDLPTGDFYFFYKWADGKAWYSTSLKGAIALCNKQGLIFKPEWISVNWSGLALCNYIIDLGDSIGSNLVCATSEYAGGSGWEVQSDLTNIIGVAINDITGCTLDNHSGIGGSFEVDSWVNNIVHDYVDDMISVIPPDFINLCTVTDNVYKAYDRYDAIYLNIENQILEDFDNVFGCRFSSGGKVRISDGANWEFKVYDNLNDVVFSSVDTTSYDSLVSNLGLTSDNNVVNVSDLVGIYPFNYNYNLQCYSKSDFSSVSVNVDTYSYNSSSYSFSSTQSLSQLRILTNSSFYPVLLLSNLGWVTVYRTISIPSNIKENLYQPSVLSSNTWNNYNSSENNSTTVTTNQIDSSITNNSQIYTTTNTEINNNTTNNNYNYSYDNSSTTINNIVNNYYGSGGDDNGGGDDDNNGIWDRLLNAIADFFSKIGDIVVAILAGVVELFAKVLEGIASIVTDFTGITDFFSTVFSFLPSDLVAVMSLALTTALLISLIRMFRK